MDNYIDRWMLIDGDVRMEIKVSPAGGFWCAVVMAISRASILQQGWTNSVAAAKLTGLFLIVLSPSCYQASGRALSEARLKQRFPI